MTAPVGTKGGGADVDLSAHEGELPWGYAENRITVVVRDPESLYLYWEITDEGIADARVRLGPRGAAGWVNLRIYDTTGHDFDGTNANDYFDLRVDRADREYYLMIRRPGSSLQAEIGIKTDEGYFQAIARSGRADFPRNSPSPNTRLDWMTVESEYVPPCAMPCRSRYSGPEPPLPGREGAGYVDAWRAGYAPTVTTEPAREAGAWSTTASSTSTTFERSLHVERWWRLDEWRAEWRSGPRFLGWQNFDPERVAVELLGDTPLHVTLEGGEMVVYGPWKVTIRDFESEPSGASRRLLSTWSMRWVRASTPLIERWEHLIERRVTGGWRRDVLVGASERYAELGASEQWRLGGSERVWIGASEWAAAGASEMGWRGASEALWMGASERLGGSERTSRFLGASEITGFPERWGGRPADEEKR
jgi:hypothetical protein